MPTAREKLEEVLRGLRQRQEQQAQAAALWQKALPRCLAIASSFVDLLKNHGLTATVETQHDELWIRLPDSEEPAPILRGAIAVFRFNRSNRSVEGDRYAYTLYGAEPKKEPFFCLSVPQMAPRQAVAEFGPTGPAPFALAQDTQQAFERAVVDFLEWALVRDGASGHTPRLP